MASAESITLFCPHLSFKVTHSRNHDPYGLRSQKKNLSGQEELEGSTDGKRFTDTSSVTSELSETVSRDGLEDNGSENHIACHDCNEMGVTTAPRTPYHLWRCLEPKCKLLLCGKQIQNHSQSHVQVCQLEYFLK